MLKPLTQMSSDLILRWTSAYNDQMISFFLTRFLFTDLVMKLLALYFSLNLTFYWRTLNRAGNVCTLIFALFFMLVNVDQILYFVALMILNYSAAIRKIFRV